MTFWLTFAASYVVALAVALAFNRGAHRKPSPRREPDPFRPGGIVPTRGVVVYREPLTETGTSGVLVADDTAETGWT